MLERTRSWRTARSRSSDRPSAEHRQADRPRGRGECGLGGAVRRDAAFRPRPQRHRGRAERPTRADGWVAPTSRVTVLDTGPTVLTMPESHRRRLRRPSVRRRPDRLDLLHPGNRPIARPFADGSHAGESTATPTRWPRRSSASPVARRQTATRRLRAWLTQLYRGRVRRLHRRELRLTPVTADPTAGPLGRDGRLPSLGPDGHAGSSPTNDCCACSPSRRSTPVCHRSARWRCTPWVRPTWTRSRGSSSPAAACEPCRTPWPLPPQTPGVPVQLRGDGVRARTLRTSPGAGGGANGHRRPVARRRGGAHHRAAADLPSAGPDAATTPSPCDRPPRRSSRTSAAAHIYGDDEGRGRWATTPFSSATPGTRPSGTSSTTAHVMSDPSLLVTRPTASDALLGAGGPRSTVPSWPRHRIPRWDGLIGPPRATRTPSACCRPSRSAFPASRTRSCCTSSTPPTGPVRA